MKEKLYKKISSLLSAIENCRKSDNLEWLEKHSNKIVGKDYNGIKDYFYDVFITSLNEEIEDKDYLKLESEEN